MLLLTKTKAVLGLHAIKEKPVAINGKVEIRPASVYPTRTFRVQSTDSYQMMYLALTYDHRLLDGREAVVFLVKVSVAVPKSRTSADMTTRSRSTSKILARCSWVEWTLRSHKLYKMWPCITPDTSKYSAVLYISHVPPSMISGFRYARLQRRNDGTSDATWCGGRPPKGTCARMHVRSPCTPYSRAQVT